MPTYSTNRGLEWKIIVAKEDRGISLLDEDERIEYDIKKEGYAMKYDFTSIMDRQGKDAIAVDSLGRMDGFAPSAPRNGFDAIPMWVADMNFPTAPSIVEAVSRRLAHPAYGYFETREEYYDAIIRWQAQRNQVRDLSKEHIGYENGVLGGVMSALGAVCRPGEAVLVHSPTYIGFTHSLENGGYPIVHSPLKQDSDGIWRMDFADMEDKIRDHGLRTVIFCSPHNPCGRVWETWELEKAMSLFEKYGMKVISDEIWSDLLLDGHCHIPTQSVSAYARENTIALYAPSKTFNLAGLIGSYHIIYNRQLREKVLKQASLSHYNSMNVLSMYALMGAYSEEGAAWLEELKQVLTENVSFACNFIRDQLKGVSCSHPEGTYMLFVDCTEYCETWGVSLAEIEKRAWDVGVAIQDGRMFHGPCHLRINLALPNSRVREAFQRLKDYVFIE